MDLDTRLRESDFASVHCPLTKDSRKIMNARAFSLMCPEAYFITTARGFNLDEVAPAEALTRQEIAGPGLDVWAEEPPPSTHPLMKFDNVLVSPHTAGATLESRENRPACGPRRADHSMLLYRTGCKRN